MSGPGCSETQKEKKRVTIGEREFAELLSWDPTDLTRTVASVYSAVGGLFEQEVSEVQRLENICTLLDLAGVECQTRAE